MSWLSFFLGVTTSLSVICVALVVYALRNYK